MAQYSWAPAQSLSQAVINVLVRVIAISGSTGEEFASWGLPMWSLAGIQFLQDIKLRALVSCWLLAEAILNDLPHGRFQHGSKFSQGKQESKTKLQSFTICVSEMTSHHFVSLGFGFCYYCFANFFLFCGLFIFKLKKIKLW